MKLTFANWLNESMSVYIQGYNFHEDIKDLDDVCRRLVDMVIEPFWNKLNDEQQQDVRTGGSMYHGIITPDGDYYQSGKQRINFYVGGWPKEMIPKMLSAFEYYLKELKVNHTPIKLDQSNLYKVPVYRTEILKFETTKNSAPELNLANDNARLIFGDLLGFPEENGGFFEISPHDLYIKIENLNKDLLQVHAREPYQTGVNKVTSYHGGLSAEQIAQRLEIIKKIAKYAMDNGYPEIYVT